MKFPAHVEGTTYETWQTMSDVGNAGSDAQVFQRFMRWAYARLAAKATGAPGDKLPAPEWLALAPEGLHLGHIVEACKLGSVGIGIFKDHEGARADAFWTTWLHIDRETKAAAAKKVPAGRSYADVLLDLRSLRSRIGVTHEQLASYFGCYEANVIAMEDGVEPISMPTLFRWLAGLKASMVLRTQQLGYAPVKVMTTVSDLYDWVWQQEATVEGYAPVPAAFQAPYGGRKATVPTPVSPLWLKVSYKSDFPSPGIYRVKQIIQPPRETSRGFEGEVRIHWRDGAPPKSKPKTRAQDFSETFAQLPNLPGVPDSPGEIQAPPNLRDIGAPAEVPSAPPSVPLDTHWPRK